ncbi:MAG: hypothetical protein M3347_00670, partial [Armatimonadota bacterium]|nr:hypothetical protein [Armatimonadota bacterium]
MKPTSKIVLGLALVAVIAGAFAISRARRGLTAEQILQRVAQTYADCKTYRDSGVVKHVLVTSKGNYPEEGTFSTAF